ncbi:MAG: hypothetical protein ACLQDC_12975 [Verrucomicrobiia bacterium]
MSSLVNVIMRFTETAAGANMVGSLIAGLIILLLTAWWRVFVLTKGIKDFKKKTIQMKDAHAKEVADL